MFQKKTKRAALATLRKEQTINEIAVDNHPTQPLHSFAPCCSK